MNNASQVFFLSHGGGPLPLLGDGGHTELVASLQKVAARISKPSAIIVVSAHWEEGVPTITSGPNPALIYDYSGFPEESYTIQYPCKGEPLLASKICKALGKAGIDARLDDQRGFDHGLFVPLKILYPEADIPCVQLSLMNSLQPRGHIQIGQGLRNLDYDNVLIIGSGFSFHNMKAFFTPESSESKAMNESFEKWLQETCASGELSEKERSQRLEEWAKVPSARFCHPREEHLLPLHVCYGFVQRPCSTFFELRILKKKCSMYLWSREE